MAETTYCNFYSKKLADVFEHEQEYCLKIGRCCGECPSLSSADEEVENDV